MDDAKLKLRQEVLKILLSKYGSNTYLNRAIYECADEWCSKQVTTNGLAGYFKAYYATKGNDQVGEKGTQAALKLKQLKRLQNDSKIDSGDSKS